MSSSDQLLDKRTLDRNITKGLVTQKEVEKHLAGLADKSANAEYLDPAESLAEELEAIEGALSKQAARHSAASSSSDSMDDDDDVDDEDDAVEVDDEANEA